MEATYIKNKGVTQTTIKDNHHHTKTNEIKWDADYNGKYANIKLDVADNGKKNKYRIKLDNKDLANMLNVPSVNRPIDQRLEMDFLKGNDVNPEMQVDLQQIQTPKSFILPQLKPELELELEPEPILYRVNIPQKKNTMSLENPSATAYGVQGVGSLQNQLLDIDRELSELSSIMVDGNAELESTDIPIQKHIKYLKQPKVLTQKVVNPITRKRNRKENKHKKLLYKTPLPKTIRIHYKTPRQNRTKFHKKKTIKRRKHPTESNNHVVYEGNRNGFNDFFRNLSK
jgi:hypothetical protein